MKTEISCLPWCKALPAALGCAALALTPWATAQTQIVKPAYAQYWMDVATVSMAGMDDMPAMPAGLGGMFGGMGGGASFGSTRGMMPGRWLDLAVVTQRKSAGTEATQTIPRGQNMGAALNLLPVKAEPRAQGERGHGSVDEVPERPIMNLP